MKEKSKLSHQHTISITNHDLKPNLQIVQENQLGLKYKPLIELNGMEKITCVTIINENRDLIAIGTNQG